MAFKDDDVVDNMLTALRTKTEVQSGRYAYLGYYSIIR